MAGPLQGLSVESAALGITRVHRYWPLGYAFGRGLVLLKVAKCGRNRVTMTCQVYSFGGRRLSERWGQGNVMSHLMADW